MKIGLVINGSLSSTSGGFLYDRKLVETLERCGDTVQIFSLADRGYLAHVGEALSRGLRRQLRLLDLDVLLEDELNHPSLFLQDRWLSGRYPVVSIVHHLRSDEGHSPPLQTLYRFVERQYLRTVDAFVFNSQATRSRVEALVGRRASGVMAYPGRLFSPGRVSEDQAIQRARSPGPLRLLYVGNIIPRKNLHILLQAMSGIPAGICRLDVIGDGLSDRRYAARVRRMVGKLDLGDRVRFLGKVGDQDLSHHYVTHHVMVMPSTHEGFGIAYLEGFEHGLPAIGTNQGGVVELIEDGENGFQVQPGDMGEVIRAILELAEDRDRLAEMSLNALKRAREFPTWDETGQRVREYLLGITR